MQRSLFTTALVLGLLSSVGPFAIDMYLPALPAIANGLNTSVAATQNTLTAYFIAFGISQLVYGPWADRAGRKVPLYTGLAIFILGSAACSFAPTIEWLIAGRFLQGLGGAVVMVIPRAIVRDLFTGTEATRLMAMIMLVISVSPMLAPLAGSLLILVWDWRAIFVAFCVAAFVSLLITRFALPETLPPGRRASLTANSLLRGAADLMTDRDFLGLTFIGGFGTASFFVFIASASFVYVEQFGLTPFGFSLAFAINAIGFFGASQLAAPISARFGMARTILVAVGVFAFITLVLLAVTLAGFITLPLLVAFLFCANACLGLVMPTTMVMALDQHGDNAGLASSLGGTLQMLTGGLMITAASPFFDGTATPMVAAIAICGACAFLISRLVLPGLARHTASS
jgi:DHA1 family bicyclomycin/chloramphenicol resistance-like MFS transporter